MKPSIAAAFVAVAFAGSAASQALQSGVQFGLEFWPPIPDRTRQVQHFIACPPGVRLSFVQPGQSSPSNAVVGGFVFVGRTMPQYLGLYKIDRVDIIRNRDGTIAETRVGAICTTGLDGVTQ